MTDIKDKALKFKNSKISGVNPVRFKEATFNLMDALESRGVVLGSENKAGAFNAAAAGAELQAKSNDKRAILEKITSDKSKQAN